MADTLDGRSRALLDRYTRAFEAADVDALQRLLRDDVRFEMPPEPVWFTGRPTVVRFLRERVFAAPGGRRIVRTTANGGGPVLATYSPGADGRFHAEALQVLTLREHRVAGILAFRDRSLFPRFGLPGQLDGAPAPGGGQAP